MNSKDIALLMIKYVIWTIKSGNNWCLNSSSNLLVEKNHIHFSQCHSMWHLSIKIRERERFLYCLVTFWENASITRHSFIQLSFVSPILIIYHIPWIEIKSTWFMMTSRNKNFIEVIYWTFIDLGWKTYYHFHKCHDIFCLTYL